MTPRQEVILASIINEYVETAEPVGSKMLENSSDFDISSATIRAEMHALEQAGFLEHPHTSAGRVPTGKAYRYFVDNYINSRRPDEAKGPQATQAGIHNKDKNTIDKALQNTEKNPRDINITVAQLLSNISGSLVITNVMGENDFYKTGLSDLFELPEFQEIERIMRVTSIFDEFENIFDQISSDFFGGSFAKLVDENKESVLWDNQVRVLIGSENPISEISDETIMTSMYKLPKNYTGSLMLIGPMRMDYARNIDLIKYTTDQINKMFL